MLLGELLYDLVIQQDDVTGCRMNVWGLRWFRVLLVRLLFQSLCCSGSFVLLRSDFVGGLIDGATSLFVERSCGSHFDFTNIPISLNFEPSSLALLLEFALARDFSFFSSISSSSFVDELSFLLPDLLST